jgi:putative mRNA 3-end processing factor
MAGERIYLDPKRARRWSFVSHAHADHAPSKVEGEVLFSRATGRLLRRSIPGRLLEMNTAFEAGNLRMRIFSSGHVLGGSQLLLENDFRAVYTSDINLEGGATCGKAEIESCDVLIIEATFGSPIFDFPPRKEAVSQIKDWADEQLARDITPVLLGYSLGKAQELTSYLSGDYQVEVHPSIYGINRKYENLGVGLGGYRLFPGPGDCNRVVIFPPGARKSPDLRGMRCAVAMASGWAALRGTKTRMGVDEAFPLSDHSDFNSLVKYVEKSSPQVVYTFHGFAEEFADELRERGFYAEALR